MPNPYGAPDITPLEMSERLKSGDNFVILDVREPQEFDLVRLPVGNVVELPLSRLSIFGLEAFPEEIKDKDTDLVIMCHHGNRSSQVTAWLIGQGWKKVFNLDGGINAYAHQVDPSIGTY